MYIYFISYSILALFAWKDFFVRSSNERSKTVFLFFFMFLFSIIAGIRYGIGTDFFTYLSIFEGINNYHDYNYLEPGFRMIISLLKGLGFSSFSMFFVFAFISLYFLVRGVKKSSLSPAISLFLFLCIFYIGYTFNGVRQGFVMSIFIYLLKDIEEKKFLKVAIFTILGTSIHYSALFILIAYFFNSVSFDRKKYLSFTVVLFFIILFNQQFGSFIASVIPDLLSSKLVGYMEKFSSEVTLDGYINRLLILSPFFLYYKKLRDIRGFESAFKIYYLGFILYAIFSFEGMFATRINMFFRIIEIILIPYLFRLQINKFERLFIFLFFIIWASFIYFYQLQHPFNFPFVTYWDYY